MNTTLSRIDLYLRITEKHLKASVTRSKDAHSDRLKDFYDGLTMGHETALRYMADIRKKVIEEIKEEENKTLTH